MTNFAFVKNNLLWLFMFAIGIASCNNAENSRVAASKSMEDTVAASTFVGGFLDTLYVADTAFSITKIPDSCKKIVFSFVFGQKDTLTMHGWKVINGNQADDSFSFAPDIILAAKNPTINQPYGAGTYFGNEILKKRDIKIIRDSLNNNKNYHFVLFVPSVKNNHIYYNVVLKDNINAMTGHSTNILVTNATANPSPPRTY